MAAGGWVVVHWSLLITKSSSPNTVGSKIKQKESATAPLMRRSTEEEKWAAGELEVILEFSVIYVNQLFLKTH